MCIKDRSKDLPEPFKKFCAQVSIDTDSVQYENDDKMRPTYGEDYSIACCEMCIRDRYITENCQNTEANIRKNATWYAPSWMR